MNVRLVKAVDGLIGRLLASLLTCPSQKPVPDSFKHILIIRPGGIGDAILLAPTINFLRSIYPDAAVTVLAERRNAGAFHLIPTVDQVLHYDIPQDFMQALQGRYDVVIDTEQWHRLSAVVARLVSAPVKIGFGTNERRRLFTHRVDYSHDDYELDSFNRLVSPLGITSPRYAVPFLKVSDESRAAAVSLLSPLEGRPFVAIFPGASIPERRWRAERFQQVAEALRKRGYSVVVVGGGEDRLAGEQIVAGGGLNLAGRTSLAETAAVLEQSHLLISGDSGILHIAVGLGIPTVSLFGPGRALKWAPRGDHHTVLNKGLPCSPCTTFGTTPSCMYDSRCMQEITVTEVIEAAIGLLQEKTGATD